MGEDEREPRARFMAWVSRVPMTRWHEPNERSRGPQEVGSVTRARPHQDFWGHCCSLWISDMWNMFGDGRLQY